MRLWDSFSQHFLLVMEIKFSDNSAVVQWIQAIAGSPTGTGKHAHRKEKKRVSALARSQE